MSALSSACHGGGVAIYTKSTLQCKRVIFAANIRILVHIYLLIRQHETGPKLLFIVIYKPPNPTVDFYNDFIKLIDDAHSQYSKIIVAGDFNKDILQEKKNKLSTIFNDACFTHIIETATRATCNSATLIDHIYSTHPNDVSPNL